jgi:FkbH-like protein
VTDTGTPERDGVHRVAVAASFTAEPLEPVIGFWAAELSLPMEVSFAGYDQVFQELLDAQGTLARNTRGLNVLLVRWADLVRAGRTGQEAITAAPDERQLRQAASELAEAVRDAAARWRVPVLVVVCPATSPDSGPAAPHAAVDRDFAAGLRSVAGVHVLTPERLEAWYPGALVPDAYTDRLGHVPYTAAGFTALGTAIVRGLHRVLVPAPKVVVVDADNTLWDGVAGETDLADIGVGPARQALQELLAAQRAAGRLLCLCSKNAPADTLAVIGGHPGMRLAAEDFAAVRINWRSKADNLRELADELGLGLDSFVFVDDNPVECAEIRDRCPQVAVLQLPPDAVEAERFLRHCWLLDIGSTTKDDERRAAYYRTELERGRMRREAPSLRGFLDALRLHVEVAPAAEADIPRVAQLTQRTNQFNLTGMRRTESQVRDLLRTRDCLVVTAQDRFGSYGQVGVVIGAAAGSALRVDTFLMSCRALGRGVEHRVLAHVGELARDRGLETVELVYRGTPRNQPAADFLRDVCGLGPSTVPADGTFPLTADTAAATVYEPGERPEAADADQADHADPPAPQAAVTAEAADAAPADLGRMLWARADLTGPRLPTVALIEERMRSVRAAGQPDAAVAEGAAGAGPASVERDVARLLAEVLGAESVDEDANFFELGGTSIQLIGFMSAVRDRFGVELPMDTLYNSELTARGVSASILLHTMAGPEGADEVLALVESMTDEQIEAMLGQLDADGPESAAGPDRPRP